LSEIILLIAQNNKCSSTIKVHTETKWEPPGFMLKIKKKIEKLQLFIGYWGQIVTIFGLYVQNKIGSR